jgi:atypical dual specificity phosphatase
LCGLLALGGPSACAGVESQASISATNRGRTHGTDDAGRDDDDGGLARDNDGDSAPKAGEAAVEIEHTSLAPPAGFSWVIEQRVAGMARPGRLRALELDAEYLQDAGVILLVSLTVAPLDRAPVEAHGMRPLHVPIEDFGAPRQAQIREVVAAVDAALDAGGRAAIHCDAGFGRTGTMLAALLVARGRTADDAIARVRELRPGSIETAAQEQAVRDYFAALTKASDGGK